jgi:hypothetical protein
LVHSDRTWLLFWEIHATNRVALKSGEANYMHGALLMQVCTSLGPKSRFSFSFTTVSVRKETVSRYSHYLYLLSEDSLTKALRGRSSLASFTELISGFQHYVACFLNIELTGLLFPITSPHARFPVGSWFILQWECLQRSFADSVAQRMTRPDQPILSFFPDKWIVFVKFIQ